MTGIEERKATGPAAHTEQPGSEPDRIFREPKSHNTFRHPGVESCVNLSGQPDWKVSEWLPRGLVASEVVLFPDLCPGKSPLPTGCAVRTSDPMWRRLAISDCGCGMQLLRTGIHEHQFSREMWDKVGESMQSRKGQLGDLGGGNHFLDALVSKSSGEVYFLIHTGSRLESGIVDHLIDKPSDFDREFARVVKWARDNRNTIATLLERQFGDCEMILDTPHNTFEKLGHGEVVIRKGAIKATEGELMVVPSSMTGDVGLFRATPAISSALNSFSHGTGRAIPRGEARDLVTHQDIASIRSSIYIPEFIKDQSLRTEAPACYRPLAACVPLVDGLVEPVDTFKVIAYLGHLP